MSTKRPSIPRNREPCAPPSETSTDSFWHSEPSALLTGHRSTRELPETADVVIIGSGVTGASIAHHLLTQNFSGEGKDSKKGKGPSVLMLEAREACWGATGRNGGHCQPLLYNHPHDPSIARFELANYHAVHSTIEHLSIDCEFVPQPGVRAIYDTQLLSHVEQALQTVRDLSPDIADRMHLVTDKKELEEEWRVPGAKGAVITSIAARMWPYKFVAGILERLLTSPEEISGSFNLQTLTPVDSITPSNDNPGHWMIQTNNRGTIHTSKLILATNGYTSHLLPFFADLIVPCRGQMSALVPLPSLSGDKRLKTSFGFESELGDYLIQRPNETGGHLMFGGGRHVSRVYTTDDSMVDEGTAGYLRGRLMENLGLPEGKEVEGREGHGGVVGKCALCTKRHLRCQRTTALNPCKNCLRRDQPCTNSSAAAAASSAIPTSNKTKKKVTELTATHEWTGIMGFSRDEHPWVGPVPDKSNLYISAGYTGHGMVNTWLCGKAVALMVAKDLFSSASTSTSKSQVETTAGDDPHNDLDSQFQRAGSMYAAVKEVGLPESYLVTKARMLRAMDLEDVEARDWAEMERARRARLAADRPASGYA